MTAANRPRYGLLDSLRGLCVLSMTLYHALYDLVYIKGFSVPWFRGWQGHVWQQSICWTFILLSGFCWSFSRYPVKRGLLLTACGAAVTLVTYFVMPSELILYGILTLLGLSALLLNALAVLSRKLSRKLPAGTGLAISLLLFFLFREVPHGFLGFEGLQLAKLPAALYQWDALAVLGFPPAGFMSSDYFPLLPWFFLYLAGHFLWRLLSRSERALQNLRLESGWAKSPAVFGLFRPLAFLGRHSLLIYLAHQPVLMAVFLVL